MDGPPRPIRTAPVACYRAALVHVLVPRSWPSRRTAVLGLVVASLAITSCIDATPYERPPPPKAQGEAPAPRVATAPANGWGDAIAWRHLDEGLAEAKAEGRPLMLVVHASWCSRCKELKPAFQQARLAELSERFVMVNADQDLTPAVLALGPDGQYLPRVLFLDPITGQPDADLMNPTRERYHYYYGPRDDLAGMMEKALSRHGKS